ncbi:GFA family protein [uncultured Tateyamaria sp.]|uniref:GFA family protein n=1 Tax=uncultured Tateyamaria sp. TaxID=455651 RepID=UPI00260289F3|nr:GFA family protein [uncultured Tateyamaria sp.]
MSPSKQGHCLCGAVQVQVDGLADEISACFCDLCMRFGGGLQMGIEAKPDTVRITGPVKSHRSSALAERAWCDDCGSPIWFRYVAGRDHGYLELSPGLFSNAGDARLTRVVYADRYPDGYWIEGHSVAHISQRDYEAKNPHLNDGVVP